MRKCRICGEQYAPTRSMQPTCGKFECQVAYAEKAAAKSERTRKHQERVKDKARKELIKTRREWMNEAQAAVNAFVRERDAHLPCISCGRHHTGQYHAGHYLSRGAHPELALEPRNIHKQCQPCNTHLSGNQLEYRKGLIARHGLAEVDWLEGPHEPKHYSIEDLKAIRDTYRQKRRELLQRRAADVPALEEQF